MKTTIIADSSALVSVFSPIDANNKLAIKVSENISNKNLVVCIPSDVFSETLNVIGRKISHNIAVIVGNKLLHDKRFLIIETTSVIRENALNKFKKQPQSVSFTDCIVMATADHFETKIIFGFDEVFHKNRYVRLGLD